MEHGFHKKNLCISLEFTTVNLVKKKEREKNEMRKEKESSLFIHELFNEYFFVTESFLHIGHIHK